MGKNLVGAKEFLIRFSYYRTPLHRLVRKKGKRNNDKVPFETLKKLILETGISSGDSVIVHSSLSNFDCRAEELIEFLQDILTPDGTLLMPTHPDLEYNGGVLTYDVEHSPSRVGTLTEVFRKMPDVRRSLHPFSSVAAWGKEAEYFLKGNTEGPWPTPHGHNSPYSRLAKNRGYSLSLGLTARDRATIKHVPEDEIEGFPISDFYETKTVCVMENGKELFRKAFPVAKLKFTQVYISKYVVEKIWEEAGCLQKWDVDGIPIELVEAGTAIESMHKALANGISWYPFAKLYSVLG